MYVLYCTLVLDWVHAMAVTEGPLHTRAKSRDRVIVRAQKKSECPKAVPRLPPKSCRVVTDPRVYCEALCDRALNQLLFQRISILAGPHTW